jgi:arylsulfatase A-like enzyme
VFGEIFTHTATDLERPALNLTHRWIRRGDWKLITFDAEKKPPELYDLRRDPAETTDRAGEEAGRVKSLREALDVWWDGR